MCGICGLVSLDGATAPDPAALAAMNETLVHRGPDSDGSVIDGPAGLAMRRLSIIDLAGGDQPIANEDGRIQVIQNGEIYNYRELRNELRGRGHTFSTHSDTEVLVHLYEERGPAFVEALRGMFALAIWDARHGRLVLARDRFGIKPLYYRVAGGAVSFASELKALLHQPGFSREIDPGALESFLAFNSIPSPLTIFAEARKLPAGHLLVADEGKVELTRYARPTPVSAAEVRTESEDVLAGELRERLRNSVRAHLVSDVPVGVLLSGGIDSSALTAMAAAESGYRVSTFSIGFEESSFDELDQARLVARRYGTDHHELILRPDAVDLLPRLVEAFDEPFGDSSALPTYLVSRLAADTVKVVLSGEGGDELFGGYYTYVADRLAPRVGRAAPFLRPLVELLPSSSARVSFDYKAKRFVRGAHLPPVERHHAWKEIFSPDAQEELLASPRVCDPLDLYRARYAETEGAQELARLQDLDLGIYLVDDLLVKTDRASMAHSLEARVPFLDPAVAELALALETRQKVRGFSKKRLLRKAVEPMLPREIVRGRKRGFSIPVAAWLRGDLEQFARDVLSPETVERQGYLSPEAVTGVLDAHVSGKDDLSRQIWGLLSFTLWFDRYAREHPPVGAGAAQGPS
ncbi:MAG TPA: asparagine synthase (glutamine-hydrolyzing) [Solirubrobacterales bacterium]|nr:asparagine synthase (glutamine-hydrolyzing) [Solirubrobacterales bacterium]